MGKFGWDLPPGVSVRDLPGNRPEDEDAEALNDAVYELFKDNAEVSDELTNKVYEWASKLRGDAYGEGYGAGVNDTQMAQEYTAKKTKRFFGLPVRSFDHYKEVAEAYKLKIEAIGTSLSLTGTEENLTRFSLDFECEPE